MSDDLISINGNYDSSLGTNLMVVFEKCDPNKAPKCKDETDINKWMKSKYIVTVSNTKHFI